MPRKATPPGMALENNNGLNLIFVTYIDTNKYINHIVIEVEYNMCVTGDFKGGRSNKGDQVLWESYVAEAYEKILKLSPINP